VLGATVVGLEQALVQAQGSWEQRPPPPALDCGHEDCTYTCIDLEEMEAHRELAHPPPEPEPEPEPEPPPPIWVNEYSDVVNEMADEGRVEELEPEVDEADEAYVKWDPSLPSKLIRDPTEEAPAPASPPGPPKEEEPAGERDAGMRMPAMELPDIGMPELPSMPTLPDIKIPEIKMPSFGFGGDDDDADT